MRKKIPNLECIDITKRGWEYKVPNSNDINLISNRKNVLIIRKKLKSDIPIFPLEDIDSITETESNAYIKAGEIDISKTARNAKGKIWLSPEHLELVKELLGHSVKIELISENGEVIKELSSGTE